MIEYILSYVTKGQKGMSIMMEHEFGDAKHGNMDLKESVHMGNVFLNGVEMSRSCIFASEVANDIHDKGNNIYKCISIS